MGPRQINPIANASRTETTIQTAYRQFQLPFASFIQNQIAKVFHFCNLIHRYFYNFATDFRKAVRHKRTKSVIELVLLIEFSQNWIWSRMGSNNAHATDIYYPERENYIRAWRGWLLLIHSIGNARSPIRG